MNRRSWPTTCHTGEQKSWPWQGFKPLVVFFHWGICKEYLRILLKLKQGQKLGLQGHPQPLMEFVAQFWTGSLESSVSSGRKVKWIIKQVFYLGWKRDKRVEVKLYQGHKKITGIKANTVWRSKPCTNLSRPFWLCYNADGTMTHTPNIIQNKSRTISSGKWIISAPQNCSFHKEPSL